MENRATEKKESKKEAFSGFSREAKTHPTSMKDLLKMYFYRLYHSKMLYVIYGVVALIAIIAIIILFEINAQVKKSAIETGTTYNPSASISQLALWCFSIPLQSLSATTLLTAISYQKLFTMAATSYFPIGFLALFVIAFFVGKDWRNRTFRNQILAGHSRLEIYLCAQIITLVIALGLVAVWELTLWVFGLAFQIPAFVDGQFDYTLTSSGIKVISNTTGVFLLCFFMSLLIYIAVSVVACAWAFIIPNSWGAVGLLYATLQLLNLVAVIVTAASSINFNTYYQLQEWLLPYQLSLFTDYIPDVRGGYFYIKNANYWQLLVYNGRAGWLSLKTVISSLVLMGGMGYLGGLAFSKRDLK